MSDIIQKLIQGFQVLPGVGPKTAQRFTYHLLERKKDSGLNLAHQIDNTLNLIKHCQSCRNFTEHDQCDICQNPKRQPHQICIVESPQDIMSIEQTGCYKGHYFVLMGRLSPLDGLGPKEIGLDILFSRLLHEQTIVSEIIIATNSTVEGEATAFYISEQLASTSIQITRLASGIPRGGEIEYMDPHTIAHSFQSRQEITSIEQ
ncbi:MAG TPA: recombination mediator RecR [Gammaproteobacteria bacterium]|nr:recombination mediator RecR [Gammaproteobacteria bacterium]